MTRDEHNEICEHCGYSLVIARFGEFIGKYVHVLTGNWLCGISAKPIKNMSVSYEMNELLSCGHGPFDCRDDCLTCLQFTVGELNRTISQLRIAATSMKAHSSFNLPDTLLGGAVTVVKPTDLRNRVGMFMMEKGCKIGVPVDCGDVQDWITEFVTKEIADRAEREE